MGETVALEAIVSIFGVLSVLGSLLIIFSYILFVEERTVSRELVTWLAVVDLGQGLFFVFSNVDTNETDWCYAQGYFGIFTATSSFIWTACIAVFVYKFLVDHGGLQAGSFRMRRYIKLFHLLSWGYPAIFVICLAWAEVKIKKDNLPWCFISRDASQWWRFVAIYIPLFICWIFTLGFYTAAQLQIRKIVADYPTLRKKDALELDEVRTRLLLIPFIFFLLRAADTIYRIAEIWTSDSDLFVVALFASMGVPTQGFANALVFVLFTKRVRQRYSSLCHCDKFEDSLSLMGSESEDDTLPAGGSINNRSPSGIDPSARPTLYQGAGSFGVNST